MRSVYSLQLPGGRPAAGIPEAAAGDRRFLKERPTGPMLVVPITTQPQRESRWSVKLARNPTPGKTCDVRAVCNYLYTIPRERLTVTHGVVPRLLVEEFRPDRRDLCGLRFQVHPRLSEIPKQLPHGVSRLAAFHAFEPMKSISTLVVGAIFDISPVGPEAAALKLADRTEGPGLDF